MIEATPAAGQPKGSAADPSISSLIAEREPSVESLIEERDPRALDAEFYSGLWMRLSRAVQREIDLETLRRDVARYERFIRREAR